MNSQNIFFLLNDRIETSQLSSNYLLEETLITVKNLLQKFIDSPDYVKKMRSAFGSFTDDNLLIENWQLEEKFPTLEIVSAIAINGANGAYARQTNKIYLAEEFLLANRSNIDAIAAVLLEEYGHYIVAGNSTPLEVVGIATDSNDRIENITIQNLQTINGDDVLRGTWSGHNIDSGAGNDNITLSKTVDNLDTASIIKTGAGDDTLNLIIIIIPQSFKLNRSTLALFEIYFNGGNDSIFDIDGNGVVETSDYTLIELYSSFRADSALFDIFLEQNGDVLLGDGATRTTGTAIIDYFDRS